MNYLAVLLLTFGLYTAGEAYQDTIACATMGYGNPESEDYPGSGYHDAKEAPENEAMREQQRRENAEDN